MTDFDDDTSWFSDDDAIETHVQLRNNLRYERKLTKREFIANLKRQSLEDLLPTIPPPNSDLHILASGAGREKTRGIVEVGFDFGTFVFHIINKWFGGKGNRVYVSTWVMNQEHADLLVDLLDRDVLSELHILCDPFFKRRHTSTVYNSLVTGVQRHSDRADIHVFLNHAKLLCISNADHTQFVSVQGSANFTAVARVENFVLSTSPDVYDFYVNSFFTKFIKPKPPSPLE